MTRVELQRGEDGMELSITGHADSGERGDIVCAACSALAGAFYEWLLREHKAGRVKKVTGRTGSGELRARWDGDFGGEALRLLACGFALMQERYPQNVSINAEAFLQE